ncbi:MAG: glycosyltransferase family 4 protein, partial [Pirellulales bacterium]|nr:glycosyltransferase family 4 protein [Pirellulales bacterium]
VFLSGSQHEGCPNGLLEAMAAGVPPVVTNVAGHRDIVRHGESGFLVPVGSRSEPAKYVKKLLDDGELAARIGNAAKETVATRHSVEQTVGGYAELYQSVL